MTIEYVLQKKTLGGWSYVSWWNENELYKADASYNSMTKGDTGYSWRLVRLEVMQEKLLEDSRPIEREEVEEVAKPFQADNSGWGRPNDVSWSAPAPKTSTHGLSGSVWVGNPSTKEKKRVPAAEADKLLQDGWIKAGPRTVL